MVKVRKFRGEFPEKVAVLSDVAHFDAEGIAEVSEEVAEVLAGIPHEYEVVEEAPKAKATAKPATKAPAVEDMPSASDVVATPEASEGDTVAPAAPANPPRRTAPKK